MAASTQGPLQQPRPTRAALARQPAWRWAVATLPLLVAAAWSCAMPRAAQAQALSPGLRLPASTAPSGAAPRLSLYDSSRWAAHLDLMATRSTLDVDLATAPRLGWQLLGDYRFGPGLQLRATGGLFGSLGAADRLRRSGGPDAVEASPRAYAGWTGAASAPDARGALPYLGLGWDTSTKFRHGWGGWGLSADLGLTTQRGEGADLRLGNSSRGLGDSLGTWRLMPVVQIGLSYAF